MLQLSRIALSKRTPGYVFWRQTSLKELEHSRRNYLLSERPVPIGEVARRMARVKARYEGTTDHHERNLLRGEYKYFSGKLCDLRSARYGDLISFLSCAGFFGFWDVAQVDRIIAELLLHLEDLSEPELVTLFSSLPTLRRDGSELYRRVAVRLASVVPDLTDEECLAVCKACTAETPVPLVEAVLTELHAHLSMLSPSQCVDMLDTQSTLPASPQLRTREVFEDVSRRALQCVEELDCMETATLYTCLVATEGSAFSEASQRRVLEAFLNLLTQSCPRSTAMMFSGVSATHSLALWFAQRMADRVLFLSTDFSPAELLSVLKVYADGLVSVWTLSAELQEGSSAALLHRRGATPVALNATTGTSATSLSCSACLTSSTTSLVTPLVQARHAKEMEYATQSLTVLRHVAQGLSDQLIATLDGAAAFLSTSHQMDVLAIYASAAEQLAVFNASTAHVSQILQRELPQVRRVLQLLAGMLIANMRQTPVSQLLQLLDSANALGNALLPDAVVTAALLELSKRGVQGLSSDAAVALEQQLRSFTNLREEHQRRIATVVVPKLRQHV